MKTQPTILDAVTQPPWNYEPLAGTINSTITGQRVCRAEGWNAHGQPSKKQREANAKLLLHAPETFKALFDAVGCLETLLAALQEGETPSQRTLELAWDDLKAYREAVQRVESGCSAIVGSGKEGL